MEYLGGGNLKDASSAVGGLNDAPLALLLAHQALDGLGYLHSQGVAHKDVKLENLLLQKALSKLSGSDKLSGSEPPLLKLADLSFLTDVNKRSTEGTPQCARTLALSPAALRLLRFPSSGT